MEVTVSACILFELPDLEHVILDTEIIILAHIFPEISNILKKA